MKNATRLEAAAAETPIPPPQTGSRQSDGSAGSTPTASDKSAVGMGEGEAQKLLKALTKKSKKKLKRKTVQAKVAAESDGLNKRRRGPKPYPVMTFEDALALGRGIVQHGAGQPIVRTTLLTKLKLANNAATKNLITTSGKYGITKGAHDAEQIELTPVGKLAADDSVPVRTRIKARFDLSIEEVGFFSRLYDKYKGGKMPAHEVMRDALQDVDIADRAQCVDLFIGNAKFVGLLKTKEGAEHLVTIEQLIAELSITGSAIVGSTATSADLSDTETPALDGAEDFDKVCFYIAPIGTDDSPQRQHSDSILASFITPCMSESKLKVVRADKIAKPGMISAHIIEYILKSRLVIADLSFHNPNVFYELCLRHVTGKPTIHIIRDNEDIPFDVNNFSTIKIDMGSVYTVLAKLDTNRAVIAQQVRQVLADGVSRNNPILAYCPTARFVTE